jgi:tRNA (guanine-N7-)-methyltransferase
MENTLRHIRSYVLRAGRLTKSQQNALNSHWRKHGVDFTQTKLNLNHLFKRHAPKILDIGTGMGETTTLIAAKHPENDYLAVEVHKPGIGNLLKQIKTNNLSNIKIFNHDVIEVLQHQIPSNCLDSVYIFFPDPWPKKRHHKRRLINQDFLECITSKLRSNARIFLATDWEDYAEHMLATFEANSKFINLAGTGQFSPRPHWRPITKFEQRGQKLNHCVWNFAYSISH